MNVFRDKDRSGKPRGRWRVEFQDGNGIRRRVTGPERVGTRAPTPAHFPTTRTATEPRGSVANQAFSVTTDSTG